MTIEYANAYSNERIAHAHAKRLQREVMLMDKATSDSWVRLIRTAVETRLINVGERLSTVRPSVPSTVKGHI